MVRYPRRLRDGRTKVGVGRAGRTAPLIGGSSSGGGGVSGSARGSRRHALTGPHHPTPPFATFAGPVDSSGSFQVARRLTPVQVDRRGDWRDGRRGTRGEHAASGWRHTDPPDSYTIWFTRNSSPRRTMSVAVTRNPRRPIASVRRRSTADRSMPRDDEFIETASWCWYQQGRIPRTRGCNGRNLPSEARCERHAWRTSIEY
jgi:hypothetical protein